MLIMLLKYFFCAEKEMCKFTLLILKTKNIFFKSQLHVFTVISHRTKNHIDPCMSFNLFIEIELLKSFLTF